MASPRPAAQFFADLDTDVSVDVGDLAAQPGPPPASVDFHSPGVYVPPPSNPTVDWPGGICTAAEAEDGLRRALRGAADGSRPLHDLAMRTLDTLSDLERAVLSGEPRPIDVAPVRKAAVMRLRVAEALASVPPPGSRVDSAALSAVLGEIDALLAEVAPLLSGRTRGAGAPAGGESGTRWCGRRSTSPKPRSEPPWTASSSRPAPPRPCSARTGAARVLSFDSAQEFEIETHERRRRWIGLVVLGVALAAAVGYHAWRQLSRADVRPPPGVPGAPSNSVSSIGTGKVQLVVSRTGSFESRRAEALQGGAGATWEPRGGSLTGNPQDLTGQRAEEMRERMKNHRSVSARGFTLIELMVVTAIVGILSSVAIPSFRLMNDRAKAAERGAVIRSIRTSLNALRVKDGSFGAGIAGAWNPVLPLSTVKRPFVVTMAGWDKLDLTIDGNLYYSYTFWADEAGANGLPEFWMSVQGDVDGNGEVYNALYGYELNNAAFVQTTADNPAAYEHMVF